MPRRFEGFGGRVKARMDARQQWQRPRFANHRKSGGKDIVLGPSTE